jgi:hypothetical protein
MALRLGLLINFGDDDRLTAVLSNNSRQPWRLWVLGTPKGVQELSPGWRLCGTLGIYKKMRVALKERKNRFLSQRLQNFMHFEAMKF